MAPTQEDLDRYAAAFNAGDILQHFGAQIRFPDLSSVEAVLAPVETRHRGGLGTEAVNGGVIAALFDLTIGVSSALVDPSRRSATVQLSMNFVAPLHGDVVRAVARVDRSGKRLVFASASVMDGEGRTCATGQGVVQLGSSPWGDSPAFAVPPSDKQGMTK